MTEKLYAVEDTGSAISNDELDQIALDADAVADRMSFGEYSMIKDGLHFGDELIAGPFEIIGRARDPQGDDWARWVRFKDADGRYHQVAVRDADLHGDPKTLAATLARQGLWISPKHRPQLVAYFNDLQVDERVTFVARTGWHGVNKHRVFVLPNSNFGADELVMLNTDVASPYGYKGSLTDWQNGIGRLTSRQRLGVLAVSTALAGPLLDLVGQDGGGIHFRGSSSTGKTSIGRASASVWGPRGYMRSWRATANGLEGAAVLATDTVLVLDELGVIDSRELTAAVYQLAIGHGKGRARRDGSMRTPASWRVMVISTGEVSIASKVEEDRNRRARAGQEVRILDILADAGRGYGAFDAPRAGEDSAAGLADEMVRSAEEFYGTAGPAFIQGIIDRGVDETIEYVNTAIDSFCADAIKFGTDGQIRRAARRLGLIAAAGELAHALGIVPAWSKGEATQAAEFALQQWIASRGGNEAAEVIKAISAVRLFIEKYGDSRFSDVDFPDNKIQNRAGYRRGKGETQVWMVLPEVFKTEVCAGLDSTQVAKVLADREMIERPERGFQKQQWIGGRNVRAYTITSRVFDDETVARVARGARGREIKDFCDAPDEALAPEKSANTKGLATLATLATQNDKDTQCREWGPTKDGHLPELDGYQEPDPEGWSFNKEDEDLNIPDFLDRRGGQS
jgi:putative DNA primase/helicase